ncbi:MAG TPA: hypothetical protein PKC39_09610 [Ferruginibacter sp.]|nr:hypothetical protein [Ferruginibacter sp.]
MPQEAYYNGHLHPTGQLLEECAGWMRLLDFLKQENAYLKTRLSEVVDYKTGKDFLNEAEHFQSLFIQRDDFFNSVAGDVRQQLAVLKSLREKHIGPDEKTVQLQQRLRNEVRRLETDFTLLKNEFNQKLAQ